MRNVLGVLARRYSLAGEDGDDVVSITTAVLIPRQDRQRIVSLGPLNVRVPVSL
jgi:hypothetical protein